MENLMQFRLIACLTIALLLPTGIFRSSHAFAAPQPGSYYLALGDSLGYGYVNDKTPLDPNCKTPTAVGYVCWFYRYLKTLNPNIQLVNLSVPGADSCVLDYGYPGPSSQCTNKPTPGNIPSPLDAAVQFLKAHPGQVSPITLDIGGDDLLPLLPKGVQDPSGTAALLPAIFKSYQSNLDLALSTLRANDPNGQIILLTQYNPIGGIPASSLAPGFADLATNSISSLNKIMLAEAAKYKVLVADVATAFQNFRSGAASLTEVPLTLPGGLAAINIHPTPEGYSIMGQVVITTYASAGIPLSASPVRPRLTVHLASKVVTRAGTNVVWGSTVPRAAIRVQLRYPQDGGLYVFHARATSSGRYRRSFPAGYIAGKGTVRVCVSAPSGASVCSATMTFRIR